MHYKERTGMSILIVFDNSRNKLLETSIVYQMVF